MDKKDFNAIMQDKIVLLDGATGTELQKAGLPEKACPELWAAENRENLASVQKSYVDSGSQIIYTCTFGANRLKLAEFRFQGEVRKLNEELARISRGAAGGRALVAGNIGPTGRFVEPFGELAFEDAVKVFKEQAKGLLDGGADIIAIETMMDMQEARAALIAVKEICDIPVMVSMTFAEDGKTLTGSSPEAAAVTLQSLGASAVGCNCSVGPDAMLPIICEMKKVACVPLIAKPNAGLPKLVGGRTVFDMTPEKFASFAQLFAKAGCNLIGGCCGTTHEFISKLRGQLSKLKPRPPLRRSISAVSSHRKVVCFGGGGSMKVIGERINPTGKEKLKDELRAGKFREAKIMAVEQKEKGADLLDVNVGASGVDEKALLPGLVKILSGLVDLPLCIDSSDTEAVENALRIYPGRALINSISFEKNKIRKLLPAAAKYGAMFILLPVGDDEIPETAERRRKFVDRIAKAAEKLGYAKDDMIVDGLTMAVSSDQKAPAETLETIAWAASEGFNTVIGLSNVSYGLPSRKWINSVFLGMAAARGLAAVIANPASEETMNVKSVSDLLLGKDPGCLRYIEKNSAPAPTADGGRPAEKLSPAETISQGIIKGDREHIVDSLNDGIKHGLDPEKMVAEILIPAIGRVGDLFDRKEYYLPQLIMSAETMKAAFDYLRPFIVRKGGRGHSSAPKIMLATVKGDIHDIGKNIVALMMRNHGFEVIDLGKDVGHEKIIEAAEKNRPQIIGLSALMTTTMANMGVIIHECREAGMGDVKFIVGGAVVDKRFADEIGADGYAADSVEAVRLARRLLG